MAFYRDRIYPALVNWLGNPKPILALRERIIPLARSTVLEIGVGSGANFPFYDRTMVERLYALEPNPGMLRLAYAQRHRTSLDIQFLTESVERIPLEDRSVDTVISTFTLCTLPILEPALRAIARVLKPDGSLIFLENSLATDPQVQRWQHLWEPIHRRVFEGLRLTRDIPSLIVDGGFRMERVECLYLSEFPKSWTHCCWGTASTTSAHDPSL